MSDPAFTDRDASGHLTSPFYGYLPTAWVNDLFLVLFGLSTIFHLVQAIRTRTWWLLPTVVLAGSGEFIGWGARTWSHYAPLNHDPYLAQIITLIVSPTPLIGALFITFGQLSSRLGHEYSRLSPRLYSKIFFTCDIVALLVQAGGGGIASGSSDASAKLGSNIMLAGIIFQLASLSVFCILVAEYLIRRIQDKPLKRRTINDSGSAETFVFSSRMGPIPKPLLQLACGLCAEATFLYIRGIYRTIELADGWQGKIIQTQSLFIVFDGVMVFLTMFSLNVFHPGRLLKAADSESGVEKDIIPMGTRSPVV
ncbi:RTA1-like protein [Trametes versicolor FP-101664 SS1]|uniref:RTA1-like protein n=1 Tax=Trametes versicolor (strain FP-101664) TaxID=717944 RepID=UPI0004624147|nr:RTA1-like protein [Trametes versicolor FP-101664 SS1]EIW64628.1 RTA1-like protein [Trametes versicolor FP-101664 SS1]